MMKYAALLTIVLFSPFVVHSQFPAAPPVLNNFRTLTNYDELSAFVRNVAQQSEFIKTTVIGQSVKGRNLYALCIPGQDFGKDTTKIKVLLFAQQHGNEQSGKEGALLLVSELLKPENRYLFDRIDLAIVPQVNPDGSEVNRRRNANGMDLNRNHLIMTEPETKALHRLFDQYLFEVTMDVHEYSPYGEEWKNYGYRKNADITVGTTTNLSVSEEIRHFSSDSYLPFIFQYLREHGFSAFEYCPGGPPEINYFRHSTFDINDGRQSLGIRNTLSFIQEGMNGKDDSVENLQHRALGQMTGMRGLLEFVYRNKDKIKNLVTGERKRVISPGMGEQISIQSEHVPDGQSLEIPLFSYFSGKDSMVTVKEYRPVVKSMCNVEKPVGYLIPGDIPELVQWVERMGLERSVWPGNQPGDPGFLIGEYTVTAIDSIDFEGDKVVDPKLTLQVKPSPPPGTGYLFIPTAQITGNMIVLALEPESMLGLVTYPMFARLLKTGTTFPVLRVIKK